MLGIYPNYASVETAVDALKAAGFRNTDISVLFPEKAGSKHFARDKGTRVPEGAAVGAGTGAAGSVFGLGQPVRATTRMISNRQTRESRMVASVPEVAEKDV